MYSEVEAFIQWLQNLASKFGIETCVFCYAHLSIKHTKLWPCLNWERFANHLLNFFSSRRSRRSRINLLWLFTSVRIKTLALCSSFINCFKLLLLLLYRTSFWPIIKCFFIEKNVEKKYETTWPTKNDAELIWLLSCLLSWTRFEMTRENTLLCWIGIKCTFSVIAITKVDFLLSSKRGSK